MKLSINVFQAVLTLFIFSGISQAAIFDFDLSPTLGFAVGSYPGQDHAVGLAAPNETAQPLSAATGDKVGAGISYDDVSNVLSFDFAYGSAFGFTDLESDYADVHIHAPGPVNFPAVNTSAGVIHFLDGFHTPSGTRSGRVTGAVMLTPEQETQLLNNDLYINVHSIDNPPGEIRGQLATVPEPSSIALFSILMLSIFGYNLKRKKPANIVEENN